MHKVPKYWIAWTCDRCGHEVTRQITGPRSPGEPVSSVRGGDAGVVLRTAPLGSLSAEVAYGHFPSTWARVDILLGAEMRVEPIDLCAPCTKAVLDFANCKGPREWSKTDEE